MSAQKFPFYGFTLGDAGRWTFDHPDQFIMALQVAVAGGFRVEEVHTYVQQPDEPVIDAQEFADWAASTDPADDDDGREAACVAACEGISTAQLQMMNEIAPGMLSRAEDIEEETGDRKAAKAVDDARAVLATYDQMRGYQSQAVSLLRAQRDRLQTQLREVNSALDDLECGAAVVKTSDEVQA